MSEKVFNSDVSEEIKTSYLNYAMSVIISRALPDVRDGLKPVHRRILYVMHLLSLTYNRPFRKCASVVGQVISAYHPHGDAAIYDSLVRLAQDFSLRYPLVDGQGNFGSMDGDKAAAYRYTEARMLKITALMLTDLDKETVDFASNFDDSTKEPTVLPNVLPNLLLNGTTGIAVGMATNIPPHHLGEVVDAIVHALDNPDFTVDDLLQFIKGPDFPTGGVIHNYPALVQAYRTGRGSFSVRAKADIEERSDGGENIIVREMPYQVNKAETIKKIAELVKLEVVKGIREVRDESSDREGVRVVIELKKATDAYTVLNLLFKHTSLQVSFGVNTVALVKGQPRLLSLKEMIFYFIEHRKEVVRRKAKFLLKKAKERLHIVEGFLYIAIPNMDKIIELIRGSSDVAKARVSLMKEFSLSELQANAILEMRLSRLVAIEIEKLQKEEKELKQSIEYYQNLLTNDQKLIDTIKEELLQVKTDFNDERRTEISKDDLKDLDEGAFIHKDEIVISFTHSGYAKSMLVSTYRQQNRGGVGIRGTSNKRDEDALAFIFAATTHDNLLLLTTHGRLFSFKAYEIPLASRIAKGVHTRTLFNLQKDESFCGVLVGDDAVSSNASFVMITKKGTIKRCLGEAFKNVRRAGIRAINIVEDDRVVAMVSSANEEEQVMFFSKKGLGIRTPIKKLRPMGRAARGVRAMRLAADDEIISLIAVDDDTRILVVSENGIGKVFIASDFSIKGRAGKGQIYFRCDEKSGSVSKVLALKGEGDIIFTTSEGNILRIAQEDLPVLSRTARGSRLVQIKNGVVTDVTYVRDL